MYVPVSLCLRILIWLNNIYICVRACVRDYVCVNLPVCISVCVCVCMFIKLLYIHEYIVTCEKFTGLD